MLHIPLGASIPWTRKNSFHLLTLSNAKGKQFQDSVWPQKSWCGAVLYLQSARRYVAVRLWARASRPTWPLGVVPQAASRTRIHENQQLTGGEAMLPHAVPELLQKSGWLAGTSTTPTSWPAPHPSPSQLWKPSTAGRKKDLLPRGCECSCLFNYFH